VLRDDLEQATEEATKRTTSSTAVAVRAVNQWER